MNIDFYGLDMYIVSELSVDIEKKLASLLKIKIEDIIISATEATLFHQGVDQNAWNTVIKIKLLKSLQPLQTDIANTIYKVIKAHTIHVNMIFEYIEQFHEVLFISSDYPRFVTEQNEVDLVAADVGPNTDIFNGNAFAPHQKAIEKLESQAECEDGICEGEEEDKSH